MRWHNKLYSTPVNKEPYRILSRCAIFVDLNKKDWNKLRKNNRKNW